MAHGAAPSINAADDALNALANNVAPSTRRVVGSVAASAVATLAYVSSNVAQVYWLSDSSLSLYGQFAFFLTAMTIVAFLLLVCAAAFFRDVRVLLPHHDAAQRRLFICTLCPCGARAFASALAENDDASGEPLLAVDASGAAPDPATAVAATCAAALAPPRSPFRVQWAHVSQTELLLLCGCNNAVASLLQWFATPASRTPPLLNGVIPCLAVPLTVPFSRWLLGDTRTFLARAPLAAFGAIAAGVAVSLAPTAFAGSGDGSGGSSSGESPANIAAWAVVNVVSQVPSAAAFVGAQAYLMREEAAGAAAAATGLPRLPMAVPVLRYVFYTQFGVATVSAALFWLDILPWFGSGDDINSLSSGIAFAFRCSLLGPSPSDPPGACAASAPLWALVGILPYALYLAAIALVSSDSAVYGSVLQIAVGVLQTVVFLIPGTNPNASATPLWSVLVSVALSVGGIAVYKQWEATQGEDVFARMPKKAAAGAGGAS